MSSQDKDLEDYVPVFNEGDKILVQKDIEIKDLIAKNKALEERNTNLLNTNNELNEALTKASFKTGKDVWVDEEVSNPLPEPVHMEYKFDIEFKSITIRDLRLKLGEIALQDNGPFDIFMRKVE